MTEGMLSRRDFINFLKGCVVGSFFFIGGKVVYEAMTNSFFEYSKELHKDELLSRGIKYLDDCSPCCEDLSAWPNFELKHIPADEKLLRNWEATRAVLVASSFFSPHFWRERLTNNTWLKILPVGHVSRDFDYLYRTESDGGDIIALNIITERYPNNKYHDIFFNPDYTWQTMARSVVYAFIHMLIARNSELARPVLNNFEVSRDLGKSTYLTCEAIVGLLYGQPGNLSQTVISQIGSFLDNVTGVREETYRKFFDIAEKPMPPDFYMEIVSEYFGWK